MFRLYLLSPLVLQMELSKMFLKETIVAIQLSLITVELIKEEIMVTMEPLIITTLKIRERI